MSTRVHRILAAAAAVTALATAPAGTALADTPSPVPGRHNAGFSIFGVGDTGSSSPFVPESYGGVSPAPPGIYLGRIEIVWVTTWPPNCGRGIVVICN